EMGWRERWDGEREREGGWRERDGMRERERGWRERGGVREGQGERKRERERYIQGKKETIQISELNINNSVSRDDGTPADNRGIVHNRIKQIPKCFIFSSLFSSCETRPDCSESSDRLTVETKDLMRSARSH